MRRLIAVCAVLVGVTACGTDPTTGRPPTEGPVPAYTVTVNAVGPGTAWPLTASWRSGCPVGPAGLRLVEVAHWGYDGTAQTGRIVVATSLVDEVTEIFRRLYDHRFQLQRMDPVDAFGGSDAQSMAANNTSAFNCRRVAGTSTWSEHAFGTAIDINPVQNPYVRNGTADPAAGATWLDRTWETPGMIRDGDAVVAIFAANGFRWGGHWQTVKDYQHFSTSGR